MLIKCCSNGFEKLASLLLLVFLQLGTVLEGAPYFFESPHSVEYETDYATASRRALDEHKRLFVFFAHERGSCSCCDQMRELFFGNCSILQSWKNLLVFCCVEIRRNSGSLQFLFLKEVLSNLGMGELPLPSCLVLNPISFDHLFLFSLPATQKEICRYLEESILAIPDPSAKGNLRGSLLHN
ncbi:hypothetical protein [Candidatus Similichlamydia epinepheli]|uniref:hypothetical protein n=1 Tax=Candidatus Similichlamydia epinepheli TaxID=1903953 RepID=UPI0013005E10|nr:hypothetical protein [Candidatus Similichlamydia epinepheli]